MTKMAEIVLLTLLVASVAQAAPGDAPPVVANSIRTSTDVAVCSATNCSSAEVAVVCVQNMCSAAPVPDAPCEAGSCISAKEPLPAKG